MASSRPGTEITLNLRRIFKAPREKVFRAWTDPEELKKWWGPEGYVTLSAEVDLRVGGKYRFGMRKLPDGEIFYLTGVYREVRAPERLVYTWRWEAKPEMGETLVAVEFREVGGSTEVVLTHEFFPTATARDDHNRGWNGCLDRLAKLL